jgi:S-adenosylmethionine decarboxylase
MEFEKISYAGRHLILDLYGADPAVLGNDELWKEILETSAIKSGATILHSHFHHFGEGYGFTGVIILAESHISFHSWTSEKYASIDIYMCGKCNPRVASDYIKSQISFQSSSEHMIFRGTECDLTTYRINNR